MSCWRRWRAHGAGRAREVGDDADELTLSYDRNEERALTDCRFWAPLSLTAEQKHGVHDPVEMERLADELPDEHVAKRWIVSGDADEVVEHIRQYVDWGLDHLVIHAPGGDQARFLGQFGADVLPRLRKLG